MAGRGLPGEPGLVSRAVMLNWQVKPSIILALAELYALLQLRSEVFVAEQKLDFQDIGNHD